MSCNPHRRIAQYRETDAMLALEQATLNERALQAETPGQYEKWSNRANDVEGVRLRLAEKCQKLERAAAVPA